MKVLAVVGLLVASLSSFAGSNESMTVEDCSKLTQERGVSGDTVQTSGEKEAAAVHDN